MWGFGRGRGRLLPRVALAVAVSAAGVFIGALIGDSAERPEAKAQRGVTLASPIPDPRATDRKLIEARAIEYQDALQSDSRRDPCGSMAISAGAGALIEAGDGRGCAAVMRARDAGLAGGRPAGVMNVRFVRVSGPATRYATVLGAQARWRADPRRSVTFVRERGAWLVAGSGA